MGSEVQVIAFVVLPEELDEDSRVTPDLEFVDILFLVPFKGLSIVFRIEKTLLEIEHAIFDPFFEVRLVLSELSYLGKEGFRDDEFHMRVLLPKGFRKILSRDFPAVRIDGFGSAAANVQKTRLDFLFPKGVFGRFQIAGAFEIQSKRGVDHFGFVVESFECAVYVFLDGKGAFYGESFHNFDSSMVR